MNSVTKIAILLAMALYFLYLSDATSVSKLVCNTCNNSRNSSCSEGKGKCVAPEGGSCSTILYFYGQEHVTSKQKCMSECNEGEYRHGSSMTYVMCCSKNLCNSF